jgi:hypothetical protein
MPAALAYRPFAILMTLAVVGAVALTWAKVVTTLQDAKPVAPQGEATAIIWDGRVFQSQAELTAWLTARGSLYSDWSTAHPGAAAVLEHRSPTDTKLESTNAAATVPATTTTTAAGQDSPPGSRPSSHRSQIGLVRAAVLVLLLFLALLGAWGAALPGPFRHRFPLLSERLLRYREQLAASAAALVIAVIVGVVLS